MEKDADIAKYTLPVTNMFKLKTENGSTENIKVELGDHMAFPVEYSSGSIPATDSQIALSSIYAEELDKKVGDTITLLTDRRLTAVMETLGFTKQDIRLQYTYRAFFVLLAGIAISSFGADTFRFTINPLAVYIVSPLFMLCAALFATILGTFAIEKSELMEWIKE